MAKRYPDNSKEELAAKRQRVDQATAGEDSLVFEGDPSHFLVKLYKTITTGGFSDVTLKFKYGETMKGHRVILSAMSPLMKTRLEPQSESSVDLSSITKNAFVKLLDFTFHGHLQVKYGEELEEVLNAAELLQLKAIGKKSEEKLKQRLTLDTCLRIFHLANRFNCKNLVEATGRFVVENLKAVSQTADWWTQAEEGITDVCLAAKRQGAKPETLAEAILEWLELNKKDPDVVTRLITNVLPLADLSVDDITTKVMPHPALRGNKEAIKLTMSAIQAKLSSSPKLPSSPIVAPASSSTTPSSSTASPGIGPRSSPATPGGQPGKKAKLLVAGWRRNESVLYQWQSGSASWDEIPIPRHGLGAAMLYFNRQVIVTGGRLRPREAQKEGEQSRAVNYSPHTMTSLVKLQTRDSTDGPPMLRARSDHGMVKIGKCIYVAGGDHTDVEEYNNDRWTVVGELHSKMKKCGVGASGEIILVVGGSEKGNEKMIQTFNTRTRANATLDVLLPMAMPEVRCAGTNQGKLVFLSKEGKMLKIAGESDSYAISPTTDLRKMTADFGATIRGQHIVVCTGHLKDEGRDSKGSVFLKYRLQDGKEVNSEIPSLPELLRVYGLTTTGIAL